MKILKFSGIVVSVHLLALLLIFANPGCSSSTKKSPSAADTITTVEPAPTITVPGTSASSNPPIAFNSDTAAINAGVRYSPTRPGTPTASTLQAEPVSNVTPATTYTVVRNDSLWSIAHKNHLTTAELASANNLNAKTAKLHPGQKLIIPSKGVPPSVKSGEAAATRAMNAPASAQVAPPAATAKVSGEALKHTVRPGETLSTIARQYGVKQGEIAVANNISDPQRIRAGMELIIPGGWQTPGSKAAKVEKAVSSETTTPPPAPAEYAEPPAQTPSPATEVPVIQVEEVPSTSR